jgi:hypothetical protein
VIFSDVGPDIRWVGNENGYAGETCWAMYDPVGMSGDTAAPGYTRDKEGIEGHRNGSLLLNVPPDRRGRFHENDVKALREFKRLLDQTFARLKKFARRLTSALIDINLFSVSRGSHAGCAAHERRGEKQKE